METTTQCLIRAFAALSEESSFVPSTHLGRLTTAVIPDPGNLIASLVLVSTCIHVVYTHTHKYTYTYMHIQIKYEVFKKQTFF